MKENELICRQWVDEVWNQGREEAIDRLFAENGAAIYPYLVHGRERLEGRDEYKRFYRQMLARFTDFNITIADLKAETDKVVALCAIKAVRKGAAGAADEPIDVSSLCLYKFRDGQITEIWNNVELSHPETAFYRIALDDK